MRKLIVIWCICLLPVMVFGDWWITTVDSNAYIGGDVSIALDSLGYPHIVYERETVKSNLVCPLKYAVWNPDSTWTIETLATSSLGLGELELDSKCRPHVAWTNHYGYKDSTGWHIENGGLEWGGWSMSFALDSKDYPHISNYYWSGFSPDSLILHWYKDSISWHCDTVDVDTHFLWDNGTSVAVDDSNRAHIVYIAGYPGRLVYAKKVGEVWEKEIVDTTSPTPKRDSWASLSIDSSGCCCVSYMRLFPDDTYQVRYARKDSNEWKVEVVDSTGGYFTSLYIGPDNYPRICYKRDSIKYSWFDGNNWYITTIDSGPGHIGLSVDKDNNSHIAYTSNSKYVRYAKGHGYVGIEEREKVLSLSFKIYPTIAKNILQISYSLMKSSEVNLSIYNVLGQKVSHLMNEKQGKDEYKKYFIINGISSGIYFCRIACDKNVVTRKFLIIRR